MEEVIAVALVIVIAVVTDLALLFIAKFMPKQKPTELKYMRWEAGNIPLATPKYVLPMQYYGYLILFMALEPVAVILLLMATFPSLSVLQLFVLTMVAVAPAIYYTFNYAFELADRRDVYG